MCSLDSKFSWFEVFYSVYQFRIERDPPVWKRLKSEFPVYLNSYGYYISCFLWTLSQMMLVLLFQIKLEVVYIPVPKSLNQVVCCFVRCFSETLSLLSIVQCFALTTTTGKTWVPLYFFQEQDLAWDRKENVLSNKQTAFNLQKRTCHCRVWNLTGKFDLPPPSRRKQGGLSLLTFPLKYFGKIWINFPVFSNKIPNWVLREGQCFEQKQILWQLPLFGGKGMVGPNTNNKLPNICPCHEQQHHCFECLQL